MTSTEAVISLKETLNSVDSITFYTKEFDAIESDLKAFKVMQKHLDIKYCGFIDGKHSIELVSKDTQASIHIHLDEKEYFVFKKIQKVIK